MLIHALIMALGTLLCAYAAFLGFIRLRARLAGGHAPAYTWKRHILAGRIMVLLLAAGAALGVREVMLIGDSGPHPTLGVIALWGAFFMLLSGGLLVRGKGKSRRLKSVHMLLGLATLLCLISAPLYLVFTR